MEHGKVFVVTVTYGERESMLRQVLDSLPAQGVAKAVVVDNGAHWPVAERLQSDYGDFVDVVTMGKNLGSASGFKAGIQRALDLSADFIWLLDDDNCPSDKCLEHLLKSYSIISSDKSCSMLAVLGFRDRFHGTSVDKIKSGFLVEQNNFCGFQVKDVPLKIWSRRPWRRAGQNVGFERDIEVQYAPYGGHLFHNSMISAIGLPDDKFVLYEDDTEFGIRINGAGGKIFLIPDAKICDIDFIALTPGFCRASMFSWFGIGEDFRLYYGVRNLVWISIRYKNNNLLYKSNKYVYIFLVFIATIFSGKFKAMKIILEATKGGERGNLGVKEGYHLP